LDLIAAFSGLFAAFSVVWILLGLFVALLLGIVAASLFVAIFYIASRFASAAERAYSAAAKPISLD
jgi:hypothetical protein